MKKSYLHYFNDYKLQLHRIINMIAIAASIAGFACIFANKGWIWEGPSPNIDFQSLTTVRPLKTQDFLKL
jgi:hypothetical protein